MTILRWFYSVIMDEMLKHSPVAGDLRVPIWDAMKLHDVTEMISYL